VAAACGQLHQPQRFAVALGFRLAEIAADLLLRAAPLLVPDHQHRHAVEGAEAADDGRVIPEAAVAMQLDEVLEQALDVVERVGACGVARQLHLLPRRQVGEDLLLQLPRARFEEGDLGPQLRGAAADAHQLLDLALQRHHRTLEIERRRIGRLDDCRG
jgi:hypothetical protein